MRLPRTTVLRPRWVGPIVTACSLAPLIDRSAIGRELSVVRVSIPNSRCSTLVQDVRPHLLRLRGVQPVRPCSLDPSRRREVLLSNKLDMEALPPELERAVSQAEGLLGTCTVRLSYDDMSMREVLRELLPNGVVVPSAYESVGHVVHVNLHSEQLPHRFVIGQVLLDKMRPRVRTVVNKAAEIHTQFRSIPLELIAGEADYNVSVQHGDARLRFDYSKVYWSSRLHTEHKRMADRFIAGQLVWDVFAGVGPFTVLAAQRGVHVLANDLNPDACTALLANVRLNHVARRAHVYNLDAAAFIAAACSSVEGHRATLAAARLTDQCAPLEEVAAIQGLATTVEAKLPDHIILNLPADAIHFLPCLRPLCKIASAAGHVTTVHCYSFSKLAGKDDQMHEALERVSDGLGHLPKGLTVRHVRSVAPGKEMLCYQFPIGMAEPAHNE